MGRTAPAEPDFAALFTRHVRRVTRLAALLGAADPEDVAGEAFCRLYDARARLTSDPTAYLNRIVVNLVRDRARRAGTASAGLRLLRADEATTAIETKIETADRQAVVDELRQLPPRQREALVLRYWLDLPVAEVAAAMGTRTGTAKSQISRGLATLHDALGEEWR